MKTTKPIIELLTNFSSFEKMDLPELQFTFFESSGTFHTQSNCFTIKDGFKKENFNLKESLKLKHCRTCKSHLLLAGETSAVRLLEVNDTFKGNLTRLKYVLRMFEQRKLVSTFKKIYDAFLQCVVSQSVNYNRIYQNQKIYEQTNESFGFKLKLYYENEAYKLFKEIISFLKSEEAFTLLYETSLSIFKSSLSEVGYGNFQTSSETKELFSKFLDSKIKDSLSMPKFAVMEKTTLNHASALTDVQFLAIIYTVYNFKEYPEFIVAPNIFLECLMQEEEIFVENDNDNILHADVMTKEIYENMLVFYETTENFQEAYEISVNV